MRENLRFFGGLYRVPRHDIEARMQAAITLAGPEGREDALVQTLAGGWRQRLAPGCASLHRPPVLFPESSSMPDFAEPLGNGRGAALQVSVDGTNSNTALIAPGYVSLIVARVQTDMMQAAWPSRTGAAPPGVTMPLQERPWFNEGMNNRRFFIPGMIGTLTLIEVVSLTALAVVREREAGTPEQIMVSPIRPLEFILGKTVPYFLIGLGDVVRVTVFGLLWFDIPFIGSPRVMLPGSSLFLLAALGLGLLLSTPARTRPPAFALNFFLVNPFFILSGFVFPIVAMPQVLQWFTLINPLRYFLVVIRAVFLKGVGVDVLLPDLAATGLLRAGRPALSELRFRKSPD